MIKSTNKLKPFIPTLIIAVLALSAGTVAAAQIALPDSFLYPIKMTTQKLQLAIAFNDNTRAKTHLFIANSKLKELEQLTVQNAPKNVVDKVEQSFDKNQNNAEKYIMKQNKDSVKAKLNKQIQDNAARKQAILEQKSKDEQGTDSKDANKEDGTK